MRPQAPFRGQPTLAAALGPRCPTAGTKQKEQLVLLFFVCQGGREPTSGEMRARPKGLALRRPKGLASRRKRHRQMCRRIVRYFLNASLGLRPRDLFDSKETAVVTTFLRPLNKRNPSGFLPQKTAYFIFWDEKTVFSLFIFVFLFCAK